MEINLYNQLFRTDLLDDNECYYILLTTPMYLLSRAYSELYWIGQAIINEYRPCRRKDGFPCRYGTFCCTGCKYLGPNGCTVMAIWCKLSLCNDTLRNTPAGKELNILRKTVFYKGLSFHGRSSKTTVMNTTRRRKMEYERDPNHLYVRERIERINARRIARGESPLPTSRRSISLSDGQTSSDISSRSALRESISGAGY